MSGIINKPTAQDEDYQSLIQRADECTDRLEALNLSQETLELIDRYAMMRFVTCNFSFMDASDLQMHLAHGVRSG